MCLSDKIYSKFMYTMFVNFLRFNTGCKAGLGTSTIEGFTNNHTSGYDIPVCVYIHIAYQSKSTVV